MTKERECFPIDGCDGVLLTPATQEELDYVTDNFREGEKDDQRANDGERAKVEEYDEIFTVFCKGDILGYFGVCRIRNEGYDSNRRVLCFMSCANVDKHKLDFVKGSYKVMLFMMKRLPSHVKHFYSFPIATYEKSIQWQKRILHFSECGSYEYNGNKFIQLHRLREEV